ncbi:MAG TPA: glycosyltransferase [Chitinispirillaceae bacterium]|nr:glycosyltransferase [Chitinispirillaceae bacterium]
MQACIIDSESIAENGELKELFCRFVKNPRDASACDHIGEYYLKNKKYDHALAYFEKALQLDPRLSSASTHLGILTTIKETSYKENLEKQIIAQQQFSDLHSCSVQQTILFVAEYVYPPLGGAEKSAITLLTQLACDGHHCIALCKGKGPDQHCKGIHIQYISNPGLIEQVIFRVKPTLILTQVTWASYVISLARKHHIPGILFIRSLEYFCATPVEFNRCDKKCAQCKYHRYNRTIVNRYRSMIKNADTIICNSEFTKKTTMEFYGKKAQVLYPAINLDEFKIDRTSATRSFIMMNQPEYYKGGDIFFSIAERMSDLKFMTVGRGTERHLTNCICYGQTDPHLFFQHARLVLVPSLMPESFGRIAVEAMFNGIPVIASNCGGLPEAVGDAGILIDDFHSVDEWVKNIRRILEDKELYSRLSRKAAERSLQFDVSIQLPLTRQIINDVVELKNVSSDRRILDFYNKRYEKNATYTFLFNQCRERLEGLCNMVRQNETYLDIGCADGAHMEVLYARGIRGFGIDVSIPNILRGMKTFPHLLFIHGFAEKIPFQNNYFDIAIMGDILEHLRDSKAVIREVFRVANALAICISIGGKTPEHISPFRSVEDVVSLFNDMNVIISCYSADGTTIDFNSIKYTDENPWVYLRVEKMQNMPLLKDTTDNSVWLYDLYDNDEVRDEWSDHTAGRDFQEITRFYCTAELVEGPMALEMACGKGDMSVVIARKEVMVHGIDIKPDRIAIAQKTAQAQNVSNKTKFEVGDATKTIFADDSFDSVIISELIERIKDPHLIINEAMRVAKPGGLLLISVSDGPDPNPDHIRCFFKESLKIELSQYTDEIVWHTLPFKRWLIVTFRKKLKTGQKKLSSLEKVIAVKESDRSAPVSKTPLPGFNIIGPVGAGNEFGARIRAFTQMLIECGYPVVVKELSVDGQQGSVNPFRNFSFPGKELPYAINCFCLHPLMINQVFSHAPSWLRLNNRYNVCLPDIASSRMPEMMFDQFNRMDAIIVCNNEVEKLVMERNPHIKVLSAEPPPFNHRKGYYQRVNFGIPEDDLLFVTFFDLVESPFLQNIDIIVDTFNALPTEKKHLAIIIDCTSGGVNEHYNAIKKITVSNRKISVRGGLIGREDTQSLFDAADVGVNCTLLNAPSPWVMEMMANGTTIISSDTPVLSTWINEKTALVVSLENEKNGYNPTARVSRSNLLYQMKRCLEEPEYCRTIGKNALRMIENVRDRMYTGATAALVDEMNSDLNQKRKKIQASSKKGTQETLDVLFLNRNDSFVNPGGDTRVMEQMKNALESRGHQITICAGFPKDISKFDIVHAFNSTLSMFTDAFAARAISVGVPFVVTSLQEDFPRYLNKAIMTFRLFEKYIDMGQPENFFDKQFEMVKMQNPGPFLTSPLALSHAAAVLVSGNEEAAVIKRYFPSVHIKMGPFGFSFKNMIADPSLFERTYNVKEFVLCVGRLEMRKNQLMLLKALENDSIPLVFVGGGVNYQPNYEQLCKAYKRKGPTLFLNRLSEELLASAFAAASVHCLPSWYELPGLVTIEAAGYGCPVVQSSWGTIADYCKDLLITCEPDDYQSIKAAVYKGLNSKRSNDSIEKIKRLSWESAADNIIEAYISAIENGNNADEPERASNDVLSMQAMLDPARLMEEVTKLVENRKFSDAVILYEKNRQNVINIPELVKFDELMKRVKVQCRM